MAMTPWVQVGRPRVQFACASALAMLIEGHPQVCPQVLRHGGIAALTIMLQTAGAQGKKAAAEALQVQSPPYLGSQTSAAMIDMIFSMLLNSIQVLV